MSEKGVKTYKSPYEFTAYKISDSFCKWERKKPFVQVIIAGPIFPHFLRADFSKYEGFRHFTEDFGLDAFAKLDSSAYSLANELGRIRSGELKAMAGHYLEKAFDRMKAGILNEQRVMRVFHEWFVKGNYPRFPEKSNGKRIKLSITYAMALLRPQGADGEFQLRLLKQMGKQYQTFMEMFREIDDALKQHLSQIRIKPSYALIPILEHIDGELVGPKQVGWIYEYDSIFPRCYMEMLDLIEDEAELKACANCGEVFFPSRKDELFCSRLAPQQRTWKKRGRRTCKELGPEIRYRKKLIREGKWDLHEQKKRLLNRLNYQKRLGNRDEYEKLRREYEILKRKSEEK